MILRMNSIRFIFRLINTSWPPHLISYVYEHGWNLVFELVIPVGMVFVAPVGSPLGYSINILIGLELGNSFGTLVRIFGWSFTWHTSWFGIGTVEVYLLGFSLGLLLGSPLESPNHGSDIPVMLLGTSLGLLFGSEAIRCLFF